MDNPKSPLRDAFGIFVKELVWRYVIRFEPRRRPICLYASRRSGSSLLMEVIGVNPGVMFSDQPFSAYTATRTNLNRLPIFPSGQIAFPDRDEEQQIRKYLEDLFAGRVRANIPWNPFSRSFHLHNDRMCLKITDAKTIIEWIDQQFEVDTVVMTRHPIAQALSVSHVGWISSGKGLLRNAGYVDRWLNKELERYAWSIYETGTELEWRVLDWVLENHPMLALLKVHSQWHFVGYEDLVAHTERLVDSLAEQLQLPARVKMCQRAAEPSRSTKRESSVERQAWIRSGNRDQLLRSWQEKVTPDAIGRCARILETFAINLYRVDSAMPDYSVLGRTGYSMPAD